MSDKKEKPNPIGAPSKLPPGKGPWLIAGGFLIFAIAMYFGLMYKVAHYGP